MSWDVKFMGMAEFVAAWSKDPSTKVGAVIVGPDHEVRATGYNGYPRGVKDTAATDDRDVRLSKTVHAELNAILNAALCGQSTKGCTMYIHGLPPCNNCANAIMQAGICRVVCDCHVHVPERWMAECDRSIGWLTDAGIRVTWI